MEVARPSTIEASRLLCLILSGKHTIKDLLYTNEFKSNKKELYAIVCKTLDSLATLDKLAESFTNLPKAHIDSITDEPCSHCLFIISCYESLNSRHRNPHLKVISKLTGDLFAFKTIRKKYKTLESKVKSKDDHSGPIYLRVNQFKTTKAEIVKELLKTFEQTPAPVDSYEDYVQFIRNLGKGQFTFDYHLPELLVVFGKGTDLYKHSLVNDKHLIIQDKASCIPPMVLLDDEKKVGDIIDCCAAPGNKTSFLAHLLTEKNSKSCIFAFDRNAKRFSFLQKHLSLLNVPESQNNFRMCLENLDFLDIEPTEKRFSNVTHILVDPSCSGSGLAISKRVPNVEDKNIPALASFQAKILKHCFKFPSVKTVVYSTCSVFEEENEKVVSEVCQDLADHFKLAKVWSKGDKINWVNRGLNDFKACLRADQKTDATNGFFVAKFIRSK